MKVRIFVLGLLLALVMTASAFGNAGAKPLVRVREAEGVLSGLSAYDEFIADTTEPQVKVVFSTETDVRDFKVLALTFENADDNGRITFSAKELYALDTLTPKRPLVVGLTFYGTIPNNGISYVDESGKTRSFSLYESGEDGSLLLSEISIVP